MNIPFDDFKKRAGVIFATDVNGQCVLFYPDKEILAGSLVR